MHYGVGGLAIGSLLVGVAAGAGAGKAPWRGLLKATIREGIRLGRNAQALAASVAAEAALLVDEARAELDGPQHTESNS